MEEKSGAVCAETPATARGPEEPIRYRADAVRLPGWYLYYPLIGAGLTTAAVLAVCVFMLLEPALLPRICGVVTAVGFSIYVLRFAVRFCASRKLVTQEAVLDADSLVVTCQKWTKRFALEDLVFTMSYSSATNLCIVAATEEDYVTIQCSCGYLFLKGGEKALTPFYAINRWFREHNTAHVDYVRNKKYRRKFPFRVPLFVFESEYDTPRTTAFLEQVKAAHGAVWGGYEREAT